MMVFFRTRLGKLSFGKNFLKGESPTLSQRPRYHQPFYFSPIKLPIQPKSNWIHWHFSNYIQLHCYLGEIIEFIDNIISIKVKSNSSIYCSFYETVINQLVLDYWQYSVKWIILIKNWSSIRWISLIACLVVSWKKSIPKTFSKLYAT